jgi:hypothetical protein
MKRKIRSKALVNSTKPDTITIAPPSQEQYTILPLKLSQNIVQNDFKVTTCETISKNYALCKR